MADRTPLFGAVAPPANLKPPEYIEVAGRRVYVTPVGWTILTVTGGFFFIVPAATVTTLIEIGGVLLGASILEVVEFKIAQTIAEEISGGKFSTIVDLLTSPFFTIVKVENDTYRVTTGEGSALQTFLYSVSAGTLTLVPGGLGSVGADP